MGEHASLEGLRGILERCEKATGADREIDALIWTALTGHEAHYPNPYVHEDDGIRALLANSKTERAGQA